MNHAVKHLDPVLGIDFHVVLAPPAAQPTPLPVPYVGIVFDPFERYVAFTAATNSMMGTSEVPLASASANEPK